MDYTSLVTSQHINQPKFMAWLTANLNIVDSIYLVTKDMDNKFDLDLAVGNQLDILGQIIGRTRKLTFQPLDGSSPTLNDSDYRFLLKAKIAQNTWKGTIPELYTIWNNTFADLSIHIQDNQDMSFTIEFQDVITTASTSVELVLNGYIVPKPQGVHIYFVITVYNGQIKLEENLYKTDVQRNTKLGVWKLGVDAFATLSAEKHIIGSRNENNNDVLSDYTNEQLSIFTNEQLTYLQF